ncbi:MAG TPA: PAS domain S-box protein [Casimicrobiaceae bacterium]|nr:PAS domain S-box protein [Casimicrobiaceae bacterium]
MAAVALATAARWLADPHVGDGVPYATYFVAVALASWIGGFGPALLATAGSAVAAGLLFVPPRGTLLTSGPNLFGLAMFVAGALVIAGIGEAMRRAQRRAADAEDAAREQAQVRLPFEVAGVGQTEVDPATGRILRANASFCEMLGYTREELLQRTVDDVTHPDDVPRTREVAAPVIAGERDRFELEKRYVRKDGSTFFGRVSATMVRGADGRSQRLLGSVVDVTERSRAEQALRESEVRFRNMADHAPMMVWVTEADGRCSFLSQSWYEFTGQAPEAGLGFGWLDAVHPDDRAAAEAAFHAAQENRAGFRVEYRLRRHDGEYRWAIDSACPRLGPHGESLGYIGSVIDISDRKATEEALRASEERFRRTFDKAPVGIGHITPDGRFLLVNETLCEILGRTREELLGHRSAEYTHPDDVDEDSRLVREMLAGTLERYRREKRYLRPDGSVVWLDVIVSLERDDAGQPMYLIGACSDITQQRAARARLRASEARYRSLAEGMPHIVWECAPDGSCQYLNHAWYAYTGAAPGSSLGHEWLAAYHPADAGSIATAWEAAVRTRGEITYDLYARMRRHDGVYRWFRVTGAPVLGDGGTVERWVGICTDVHDVRELIGALQEADQRKDEFLATLAHELRNPLAPIRNAVEYMKLKGSIEPSLAGAREMIERQLAQMVRLIDDLLDVSRITRGKLELRRERVELRAVVRQAIDTARPVIEAGGHRFESSLPPQPVLLDADPVRLAQVLANLLNNAAKYTPPGGSIHLRAEPQGDVLTIAVRDTGIGLAADQRERVFDMFAQFDPRAGHHGGGLGIGLTLVKRLVEMHGGSVEAQSAGPGLGSEFVVRLPTVSAAPVEPVHAPDGRPALHALARRVLIVDDNRDAAVSLGMVLTLAGCATELAHDGVEALETADRWRPDVVLLDLGLPGMDGHAVCRAIRERPWGRDAVIVAVTGWGQDEDRRRSKEAGFDSHLVKPVDHDTLLAVLDAAVRARPRRAVV